MPVSLRIQTSGLPSNQGVLSGKPGCPAHERRQNAEKSLQTRRRVARQQCHKAGLIDREKIFTAKHLKFKHLNDNPVVRGAGISAVVAEFLHGCSIAMSSRMAFCRSNSILRGLRRVTELKSLPEPIESLFPSMQEKKDSSKSPKINCVRSESAA